MISACPPSGKTSGGLLRSPFDRFSTAFRGPAAGDRAAAAGQLSGGANKPVRAGKIGRNDPCPCGSGLKWKKCTCQQYHPDLYKQSK